MVDLLVGLDLLHGIDGLLADAALVAAVQRGLMMIEIGLLILLFIVAAAAWWLRAGFDRSQLGSVQFVDGGRLGSVGCLCGGCGCRACKFFGHIVHFGARRLHLGRLLLQVEEFRFELFGMARRWYDVLLAELRVYAALCRCWLVPFFCLQFSN